VEATATGNLLIQALALGELSSVADVRAVVRRSFDVQTYRPDPAKAAAWDDAYSKLQTMIENDC
jgi:hypothetical protein